MIIFANLAVIPKDPDFVHQFRIIRYHRTRLTERAEILPGVKAETSGVAQGADPSSFVFGPMRLASVLHDKQTMLGGKFQDRIHVGRLTVEVNRNNGLCPSGQS